MYKELIRQKISVVVLVAVLVVPGVADEPRLLVAVAVVLQVVVRVGRLWRLAVNVCVLARLVLVAVVAVQVGAVCRYLEPQRFVLALVFALARDGTSEIR